MARLTKAQAAAALQRQLSEAVDSKAAEAIGEDWAAAAAAIDQNIADCTAGFGEAEDLLTPVPPPPPSQRRPVGPEVVGLGAAVGVKVLVGAIGDVINGLGNLGRRRGD